MTQHFPFRVVRYRMVMIFIGGTAIAGTAIAQSGDHTITDREALKLKLQQMDVSPEKVDQAVSRRVEFMRDADANADGVLTVTELNAALEAGFSRIDRNADGLVREDDAPRFAGRDRFLSRVTPIIDERDTNSDGAMNFGEFSEPPLSRFSLMDDNGDGEIDLDAIAEPMTTVRSSKDL